MSKKRERGGKGEREGGRGEREREREGERERERGRERGREREEMRREEGGGGGKRNMHMPHTIIYISNLYITILWCIPDIGRALSAPFLENDSEGVLGRGGSTTGISLPHSGPQTNGRLTFSRSIP